MFLTVLSKASKLGGMQATYVGRKTCPPSCPLFRDGCYAEGIRVRTPWLRAEAEGRDLSGLLREVRSWVPGTRWRYAIAGDLPGEGETVDGKALSRITSAVKAARVQGWTYTHKDPAVKGNARAIAAANDGGFTVNISVHGPVEADDALALGIAPVVMVLPERREDHPKATPSGVPIVQCPATVDGSSITCASCGGGKGALCARRDRAFVVGFPVHGVSKKKAEATYRKALPVLAA